MNPHIMQGNEPLAWLREGNAVPLHEKADFNLYLLISPIANHAQAAYNTVITRYLELTIAS